MTVGKINFGNSTISNSMVQEIANELKHLEDVKSEIEMWSWATKYERIKNVYERDHKTNKVIEGKFSLPEFEYLAGNKWDASEKIHGRNTRVLWDGNNVHFRGRSDKAQMPTDITEKLVELFTVDKFKELDVMCLYGEMYGLTINKGGCYKVDGVDFALFDVKVGKWWLRRKDIIDVAKKLDINIVPYLGLMSIADAIWTVKKWTKKKSGSYTPEGIVLKSPPGLKGRNNQRIIMKIKTKDFCVKE